MLYFNFRNYGDFMEWSDNNDYQVSFIEDIGRSEVFELTSRKDNSTQLVSITFEEE